VNGNLRSATYYISRSTVAEISSILNTYKAVNGFIDIIKIVLPDLVKSLACTACVIADTVLTVIATVIGFYIDRLQEVLNAHSNSNGVTFRVKYGIFLQQSSIQAQ
jgi:hypothetical protein